jgi:hypothetical protein
MQPSNRTDGSEPPAPGFLSQRWVGNYATVRLNEEMTANGAEATKAKSLRHGCLAPIPAVRLVERIGKAEPISALSNFFGAASRCACHRGAFCAGAPSMTNLTGTRV